MGVFDWAARRFIPAGQLGLLRLTLLLIAAGSYLSLTGCQYQAVSSVELQIHQSRLDKNGLTPLQENKPVRVTCAPPDQWDRLPLNKTLMYSHQQWRSPDRHVGMGVALIHLPLPLSAEMVIWFAKGQYARSDLAKKDLTNEAAKSATAKPETKGGRLIAQWKDSLGRCWFEAENQQFHIKGYAITHGFDAWIVYSGYRVQANPRPDQIDLAEKAAESVAPMFGD